MNKNTTRFIQTAAITLLVLVSGPPAHAHYGGYDVTIPSSMGPAVISPTPQALFTPSLLSRDSEAAKLTGGSSSEVMTGAATSLDGERYNRQLHQHEIDRAKKYAKQFQKWVKDNEGIDITEEEAEGRLVQQMLRWADYETYKADDSRDDRTVARFYGTIVLTTGLDGNFSYLADIDMLNREIGKRTIQVTDEEYRNPNINMDIRLRNPDSYAKGEAQRDHGLTGTQQLMMRPYDSLGLLSDSNRLAVRYGGPNSLPLIIGSSSLNVLGSELDKLADTNTNVVQQLGLTTLKTVTTAGAGMLGTPLTLERQSKEFEANPSLATFPIIGETGRNIGDTTAACATDFSVVNCSQMAGAYAQGFLLIAPFLPIKAPAAPMTFTSDSASFTMTNNLTNSMTMTGSSASSSFSWSRGATGTAALFSMKDDATWTSAEQQSGTAAVNALSNELKLLPAPEQRLLLPEPAKTVNFYGTLDGDLIPATGYRYISQDAPYLKELIDTQVIPANPRGTYLSFDKYDTPSPDKLQVPHDASIRVSFDTLQLSDDLKIPYGQRGKANYFEPITRDFPMYGSGGAYQAVTTKPIIIDDLRELKK